MKQELIEGYLTYNYDEDERDVIRGFVIEAIKSIESKTGEVLKPEITEHSVEINKDDLFTDITQVINKLTELRDKGYSELYDNWTGCSYVHYMAVKDGLETNEEFYKRITPLITNWILEEKYKISSRKSTQRRIKELENEIRNLKKSL